VFRSDERYFNGDGRSLAISVFFDDTTLGENFWQLPELTTFRHFLHHSHGGFRVTGDKRQELGQKLEAIASGNGIDKLIFFLEILKLLSDEKEMQPLSKQLFQSTIKTFDGGRLNKVLEFTFREYHRAIRLEEAAAIANLTVEAFCKYFKTRTRKTYINFLNEIRINNACRLLSGSEEPVVGVCFLAGFNNLSNFNRLFKKINGLTPLEYRKKHQLLS
jgi:AraC-like DNA-binding protein